MSSNDVSVSFAPLSYAFEDQYYKDQLVCRMDVSVVHAQLKSLSMAIGNGYNGLTPTSPGYMVTVLNLAKQVEASLAKLSEEYVRPRSEILKELVTAGSMPSITWPKRNDLNGPISTRMSIFPGLPSNSTNVPGEHFLKSALQSTPRAEERNSSKVRSAKAKKKRKKG